MHIKKVLVHLLDVFGDTVFKSLDGIETSLQASTFDSKSRLGLTL